MGLFIYFFVLIQKSNKKNQGQPEWLRPFVRPAPPEQNAFFFTSTQTHPIFRVL